MSAIAYWIYHRNYRQRKVFRTKGVRWNTGIYTIGQRDCLGEACQQSAVSFKQEEETISYLMTYF